jgi:hypothetical protein
MLVAVETKKEEEENNQQLTSVTNPFCHIPPFILVVFCSMFAEKPRFQWTSQALVSFFILSRAKSLSFVRLLQLTLCNSHSFLSSRVSAADVAFDGATFLFSFFS